VLDTVGVNCDCLYTSLKDLDAKGWNTATTVVHKDGERSEHGRAWLQQDGVHCQWYGDGGRLTVSASLPKLLYGRNDLLIDWTDCVKALDKLTGEVAPTLVGVDLPALDKWDYHRLDVCYGWPREPGPYFDALALATLPRTSTVRYRTSVHWRSPANKTVARFYDKTVEAGHTVDLPARFEVQLRPKRQVRKANGHQLKGHVDELTEPRLKAILQDYTATLGLDRPIPSEQAALVRLVEFYGRRKGQRLWSELMAYRHCQGRPAMYSDRKCQRIEHDWHSAGIRAASPQGELPALAVT
jgi:hypothetical protein